MQRWLAALLLFPSSAFAYEHPVLTPSMVTLKPGETTTLALTTWWSGLTALPQHNLFVSDAPDVAEANGSLTWVGEFGVAPVLEPVKVIALTPGVGGVVDSVSKQTYATIVVTCDPPGTTMAFPLQERVSATPLQDVKLEIRTAGFENPAYLWHAGEVGDYTNPPNGSSSTNDFIGYAPGIFHEWAEVWDQCNHATVEFTIDVIAPPPNRRRAARH